MKYVLVVLNIICSLLALQAQKPIVEWQKCLGGNAGEYGNSVQQTSDGGYIVAGYTQGGDGYDVMGYHGNPNQGDIWVVKLSSGGDIQWQKCLGGVLVETGAKIREVPGGYLVVGTSASTDCNVTGNHGGADVWVVKLSSGGDVQWQKSFGGSADEYASDVSISPDGQFFIAAQTRSIDGDVTGFHGSIDYWVIKISAGGDLIWQKTLGGMGEDIAYGITSAIDGGCVVTGSTQSIDGDITENKGFTDCWIVKLDNAGNIQWQKSVGGDGHDVGRSVKQAIDGGYIVGGYTETQNNGDVSGNHGAADGWVIKFTSSGEKEWQQCYGGTKNEKAYDLQVLSDGGYIIAGSAESSDGQVSCKSGAAGDVWIVRISPEGDLIWDKTLGGNQSDEAFSIQALNDESFILAGYTTSSNIQGYHGINGSSAADVWVVKLTPSREVIPEAVVTVTPGAAYICSGGLAHFYADAKFAGCSPTFQWEINGSLTGFYGSVLTTSRITDVTNIVCHITRTDVCEPASSQFSNAVVLRTDIRGIQPAVVVKAANANLCKCAAVVLKAEVTNGGDAPQYNWQVNGVNTKIFGPLFISNTLKQGDVVRCIYRDNSVCTLDNIVSNSIEITAAELVKPSVNIEASANPFCSALPVTFTAITQNAGDNILYDWKINGSSINIGSQSFSTTALHDGDKVSCVITPDPNVACVQTDIITSNEIVMNYTDLLTPSIGITASANPVCTGSIVTFTATIQNVQNGAYMWMLNGKYVGSNSPRYINSLLKKGDQVYCMYLVQSRQPCVQPGTLYSNVIEMDVQDKIQPAVSIESSSVTICAGDLVTFTATPKNTPDPVYQWQVNGINTGPNGQYFNTSSLNNGDKISCVISNSVQVSCLVSGSNASNIIEINVVPKKKPSVTIVASAITICTGSEVTFSASVVNAGVNPVYKWKINGVDAANGNAKLITTSLKNGDRITCTVAPDVTNDCIENAPVTSNEIMITVTENLAPVIIINPSANSICAGTMVVFNATIENAGSNPIYQWNVNNIVVGNNTPDFSSTALKNGDIISCLLTPGQGAGCAPAGTITSNTVQMQVTAVVQPSVKIVGSANVVCKDEPVAFTANVQDAGSNQSYKWYVNNTETGSNTSTYISSSSNNGDKINCVITINDQIGCFKTQTATSNTIIIDVSDKQTPGVNITASASDICAQMPVTFNAVAKNAGNQVSYRWMVNGISAGTNSSSFVTATLKNADIVSCAIKVDPAFNCVTVSEVVSGEIVMKVIPAIPPVVDIAGAPETVCKGSPMAFKASVQNGGNLIQYVWKQNGELVGDNNNEFKTTVINNGDLVWCEITPGQDVCYRQTVASGKIVAVVNELPVVQIIPADTIVQAGSSLQLNAHVTGAVKSFTWSPADKLQSVSTLTPVTIPVSDKIVYTLKMQDNNDCISSVSAIVNVFGALALPNAFTPNNDGLNDEFKIPAYISITLKEFAVFDRWGNKVFSTKDPSKGWDGTWGGRKLETGNYVYIIRGRGTKGEIMQKGNVILIR